MSATWVRVKQILADALELDPGRRRGFLDQRCAEQPELRPELDELMDEHDRVDWLSTNHSSETDATGDTFGLASGCKLGPYEILRELGRGGAGVVYLARRLDHFRKLVAIKLLFPQFRTGDLARRFHVERQILATLEHPSIARLLDGGVASTGEPYLVIEYIEGVPLDEFCRANGLPIRRRLELFQRVCAAVDYAHRRLIVHRDLKPANILVTADGEPKLLDFGIAKLLDPGAITRSAFHLTLIGLHSMTPEYASPEQARGERVTTSSDVYSLGVLLYLVLADRLPYQLRSESLHAVIQSICEREPSRLPELPRDLEAITLRALEKQPDRRYPSAAALSDDLAAWLDGRPVQAARGTRRYRAGKFVRRHAAGVLAAALAFVLLGAGLGTAVYQRRAAIEQRDRAELLRRQSERRLEENQRLAHTFLFESAGKLAAASPDRETRRSILLQAGSILDRLATEGGENPASPVDLAQSYLHLSALQSDPAGPGPADPENAQINALRAQRILARQTAHTPEDSRMLYLLALCYLRLGDAYFFGEEYHGSFASYHEAVRRLKRLFESISVSERDQLVAAQSPSSHVTPERIGRLPRLNQAKIRDRLGALEQLGAVFAQSGFDDQATAIYLVTLNLYRPIVPQYPDDKYMQSNYGHSLEHLGDLYVRRNLGGAPALYAEAHRILRNLPARSASEEQSRRLVTAIVERKIRALKAAR